MSDVNTEFYTPKPIDTLCIYVDNMPHPIEYGDHEPYTITSFISGCFSNHYDPSFSDAHTAFRKRMQSDLKLNDEDFKTLRSRSVNPSMKKINITLALKVDETELKSLKTPAPRHFCNQLKEEMPSILKLQDSTNFVIRSVIPHSASALTYRTAYTVDDFMQYDIKTGKVIKNDLAESNG